MNKIALMSRVSSDEQAKGYSLDIQEEHIRNFCDRNKLEVAYVIKEDHSAQDFNRPEFKKFLQYAQTNKGAVNKLLFTTWDRFSRNIAEAYRIIAQLRKLGIEPQAIEQPIDLRIPENKMMLALYLAYPEIENDRRSIKITEGIRAAAKAGRWCRKAPIGYRNTRDEFNKPIIVLNEKAKFVQTMFEEIAKGLSQSEVKEKLAKDGFKISRNGISNLLRATVYMGRIHVNALNEEPEQLIKGLHPGIVSEGLFYQVQSVLDGKNLKTNKASRYKTHEELPLRNLLKCSKCGSHLTGSFSRGKYGVRYGYYHCNHCSDERYPAGKVNEVMLQVLREFRFKQRFKDRYSKMVKDMLHGDEQERTVRVKEIQESLRQQEERLNKLEDMLIDGKIDYASYTRIKSRHSNESQTLEAESKDLREVKSLWEQHLKRGITVLENMENFYEKADVGGKQQLLSSIFPEKITFDGEKCRTPRVNEILRLTLLNDRVERKTKKGQLSRFLEVSPMVELVGVANLLTTN